MERLIEEKYGPVDVKELMRQLKEEPSESSSDEPP